MIRQHRVFQECVYTVVNGRPKLGVKLHETAWPEYVVHRAIVWVARLLSARRVALIVHRVWQVVTETNYLHINRC